MAKPRYSEPKNVRLNTGLLSEVNGKLRKGAIEFFRNSNTCGFYAHVDKNGEPYSELPRFRTTCYLNENDEIEFDEITKTGWKTWGLFERVAQIIGIVLFLLTVAFIVWFIWFGDFLAMLVILMIYLFLKGCGL